MEAFPTCPGFEGSMMVGYLVFLPLCLHWVGGFDDSAVACGEEIIGEKFSNRFVEKVSEK